jgi:hypothetical protein
MDSPTAGELVTIAGEGPSVDGIVFDMPSRTKVRLAVMDPRRGPVFRTVHPKTLAARVEAGPDDRALQLLVRRTPTPKRGATGGGIAAGHGRSGHARGASHRTTGK